MSGAPTTEKRMLAIAPNHRGFGYVVFEGPERLVDWGVRHVEGDKNKNSIAAVGELIGRYQPQVLVVEDINAKHCRRRERVRKLINELEEYTRERGLTVRRISQVKLKRAFLPLGIRNKHQMARFIAARFPELARFVPSERKPWMSEDERMAIFDAAAHVLARALSLCLKSAIQERT